MPQKIYKLTIRDFAKLFGADQKSIPKECGDLIDKFDFRYRKINQSERDQIILSVLRRLDSGELSKSGKKNKIRWERGWSENLENFTKNNYDISRLVPLYLKPNQPMRFCGDYIMPLDSRFEVNWYTIFRIWFFSEYLKDSSFIYEFGCGTGYNLPILAKLYPEKKLHGLDWVEASRDIVNKLAKRYNWNMEGRLFDMFSPDEKLIIKDNGAILTMDALEQLGENYKIFLDYLLKKFPLICAHMEPLVELYDQDNLFDYLAIKFHKKRGYLGNFLTSLKKMESENKIRIIKIKKVALGNLYHDAYCFVVWRPNPRI